ncbi:hypothetical protein RFUL19S_05270 [Rhizobacter fulvus]
MGVSPGDRVEHNVVGPQACPRGRCVVADKDDAVCARVRGDTNADIAASCARCSPCTEGRSDVDRDDLFPAPAKLRRRQRIRDLQGPWRHRRGGSAQEFRERKPMQQQRRHRCGRAHPSVHVPFRAESRPELQCECAFRRAAVGRTQFSQGRPRDDLSAAQNCGLHGSGGTHFRLGAQAGRGSATCAACPPERLPIARHRAPGARPSPSSRSTPAPNAPPRQRRPPR